MTEEFKNKLIAADVDLDGAMERFMNNEAMYEKFLKKFANETIYDQLVSAVEEQDADKAFSAAHTLKGVCGNLSLQGLFDIVSKQVECFRAKDMEKGGAMMPQVTAEYEKVMALIKEIL
ncbi:MAG: Hpt domain-containing protein [Clostridium sp.]|nr:Hpt domain-containing protein [Clostridium sp.]MCM1399049.1 Hpt domain-containing protein [Clostridium sp.]MCM1459441.1 Hpt domain-containing protein [Bacteroides sp.]